MTLGVDPGMLTFVSADIDAQRRVMAGLDEGILSLYLPILVCMENPYKKNK